MRATILHTVTPDAPERDPVVGQIEQTLASQGHDVTVVAASNKVEPLVAELVSSAPELVFNLAESFDGKSALESSVTGLMNLLDLRYTGSSPAGLLISGDKSLTKKVLTFHEISTPQFATVYRGALDSAGDLDFPLIVKPPQEDASIGLTGASVVHDLKQLLERMSALQAEFNAPVLVEQYIEGREFYVGVLGNTNAEALPIIELDFTGFPEGAPRIASWEAKWGTDGAGAGAEYAGTKSVFPESLDTELAERMQKVAVEAFHALRLRDYARIDLRVSPAGDIYVIEVNPNCYLEKESEFANAARKSGLEYDALIARITELALARYSR
jgi:D-alanine-D-alanine ligase